MEKRYMISDAAKLVDVEAHVLRYWEDELSIEIPRNEMGHRYYTDKLINLFKVIKELKDRGFLLKAIKMVLPELENKEPVSPADIKHITEGYIHNEDGIPSNAEEHSETRALTDDSDTAVAESHLSSKVDKLSKMEQFQLILGNIVTKALQDNNDSLGKNVSDRVSDSVLKQMDYLMRIQEEHEEERFKKLDETIRNCQLAQKEAAAAAGKKRKFFKTGRK